MTPHPKKGMPVKISAGPLIGQYFVITDYVVNQFQGKDIKKIAEKYSNLGFTAMEQRGYPVDGEVVFGRLYPSMTPMVVHDKELKVDMKVVQNDEGEDVELPINVEPITKKVGKTTKKVGGKKATSKSEQKRLKALEEAKTQEEEGGSDDAG